MCIRFCAASRLELNSSEFLASPEQAQPLRFVRPYTIPFSLAFMASLRHRARGFYHWMAGDIGLDLRRLLLWPLGLTWFVRDLVRFRRSFSGRLRLRPALSDRREAAGTASGEYFLQDLHVTQRIAENAPVRHVDVGSKVDSFVAHVASFRPIEVVDIRPLKTSARNILFVQADLAASSGSPIGLADSVSCLHTLEHIGLGRYGDPVDAGSYEAAFASLAAMVAPGGRLFLSTPVGVPVVHFNSHRIFAPGEIVRLASLSGLQLDRLVSIHDGRAVVPHADPVAGVSALAPLEYALAIFEFVRPSTPQPSAAAT